MTNSVRAKWVVPVESPPIPGGSLVVSAGRIAELGPASGGEAVDLGDVAVLPALVNAHTHLEFSELEQPIGVPGLPFTEWIRQVVTWKFKRDGNNPWEDAATKRRLHAVQRGLDECARTGTGTLGEIATLPDSHALFRESPLTGIAFLESIGLSAKRQATALEAARAYMSPATTLVTEPSGFARGLSPHAPYTVHPDLLRTVVDHSRGERFPLAMHLAESPAEVQLLRSGSGPFVDLLQQLGAWEPDAFRRGTRALDYLRLLAQAHRSLVIHGNYLDDEEINFLGEHSERLSLVYCPRTHEFFGHHPYPLRKIHAAGVRMALGTDSRASNPNLNLWEELQFAIQRHQEIPPQVLLRAATLDAAQALGLDHLVGSLRVGKLANFIAIRLPSGENTDPSAFLTDASCAPTDVFLLGRQTRQTIDRQGSAQ